MERERGIYHRPERVGSQGSGTPPTGQQADIQELLNPSWAKGVRSGVDTATLRVRPVRSDK